MHSYSQDLRDRVLRAIERGDRPTAIAQRFEVSRVWVYQVRKRWQSQHQRTSLRIGGHRVSRLAEHEQTLREWIQAEPDLTLEELRTRLLAKGIETKIGALWHQLNKWELSFKKTLNASEQNRPDVKQRRIEWLKQIASLDAKKFVFIDETWASTNMTRRYGRAPRNRRCVGYAPHGHWKTTTFIGGLRADRIIAPMVTDGPMDGELFLAWVKQFLCPALEPGDIVILDNLGAHKVAGVQRAIRKARASLLYLPPYSPDMNPIERLFSKLKSLLRKAAKRTVDELWKEIGVLLQSVTPQECRNFYGAAGIVCT